ncbi:MAG: hypothetical protein U5P10_08270 [Spirochaetia bacterium]|nr:hypothetical protein [Spirochaetia bacterium]
MSKATEKKLSEVGDDSEEVDSGGGLFGNLFGGGLILQPISVQMFIPWLSIGDAEEFRDTSLIKHIRTGSGCPPSIRARGCRRDKYTRDAGPV